MILGGRNRCDMPCQGCGMNFSVFKRKRVCSECERVYCSACLLRGGSMCAPCRLLSTRPLMKETIVRLKVRDLQSFLERQHVSTRGCVEKDELVNLCVLHVNSGSYRRGDPRGGPANFTAFKGLTNFFNSIRQPTRPAPPTHNNCHNSSHRHHPGPAAAAPSAPPERFTVAPDGERDVRVPPSEVAGAAGEAGVVGEAGAAGLASSASGHSGLHVDTADCFEVEDLDEAGFEFVTKPAEPLPNDSEVLISATESSNTFAPRVPSPPSSGPGPRAADEGTLGPPREPAVRMRGASTSPPRSRTLAPPAPSPATPHRAASELELNRTEGADADTTSLQDEPLMDSVPVAGAERFAGGAGSYVPLAALQGEQQLQALSVRQLRELLAHNNVPTRGCLEREDLLLRARRLWRDYAHYKDEVDQLPIEECCKICMAAPLECVLLECGHIAVCAACSRLLAECPICRSYVARAVRFFRS